MENKNYLDDKRNRIVMLIVICVLVATAIVMLLSVPSALRSNTPNVIGGEGDDILIGGGGANRFICGGGEDTITDYNETEGDTKTADCENF
ncbi:MAG: putative hemolysin-type calcium-binding region [Nitrososphaera sp.]|jgi:Ca2+-binding RTX toxin-like protein|nr:putative hemolysin-type calcium-binding region [Nitrososphaera sp.]